MFDDGRVGEEEMERLSRQGHFARTTRNLSVGSGVNWIEAYPTSSAGRMN